MTELILSPTLYVTAIVALLIGIWIGMALRGGAKRRALLAEERLGVLATDHNTLIGERDALRLERDSLDERLRPLAAEVDRLKRVETRRDAVTAEVPVDRAADPAVGDLDPLDIRRLKGVGDRFAAALGKLGITRIDQIAAWSGADADVIDSQLGSFSGRIRTDRLVEQARLLHEGRTTEYETRFGSL
jgi:predicted flap endonuclease-1-like 5' DNA nuclease